MQQRICKCRKCKKKAVGKGARSIIKRARRSERQRAKREALQE